MGNEELKKYLLEVLQEVYDHKLNAQEGYDKIEEKFMEE